MEKRKIILDCDPGHDDAIALILAARHPDVELLGITTVAGNQTLDKVTVNALHLCEYLELDVPVYAGMPLPMVRQQRTAGDVHGESGLDGPVFEPLKTKTQDKNAVTYIIETLMAAEDGEITLIPVGPLTNIAVAMRMEPRILPKIREIIMMGGAYGVGNITPAAEFNFFADPEAAHVVFESGCKLTMMGLDLTNQTVCTMDIIERMEAIGNKAGKLFGDIMRFTLKTQNELYGLDAGPVHDVTCVAYMLNPDIFTVQDMHVEIDIANGPSYGRSVADVTDYLKLPHNCTVGITLELDKFWDMIEEAVRRYN